MTEADADDLERLKARVGRTVCRKWRLDALLGEGGMAAVYAATHHVGHRVAIKILHPEIAVSREHRARFEQEARAVARLGHPGTVQILDIDVTEEGEPFLVMELLDGENLRERAFRLGAIPANELLGHVETVLDVLSAAHAMGIVHRDIKPDNLFVTRDGRLKVLDFGIARVKQGGAGVKTRTGALMGTTSYMAPEQILGREVDGRADLYAVGATMFTLLSGRRLHDAATEGELLVKMSTTPAPPLLTVAPEIDPRVARVVDRALAFQVERRYPDAQTMLADVRAVRRGELPPFATAEAARREARPPERAAAAYVGSGPAAATYAGSAPAAAVYAGPASAVAARTGQVPTGVVGTGQAPPVAARRAQAPRGVARPPRLGIVAGAAALLFCVGVGAALLVARSFAGGAAAEDEAAPAPVPHAASAAAAPGTASPGAADASACKPGLPCTCDATGQRKPQETCLLTCGDAPACRPDCSDRAVCDNRCGAGCQASCARITTCDTRCTDNCTIDCRNAGTCRAACGAGCSYTCEDAASCGPVVGDRSVVRCNRVGLCQVTCTGSCAVSCSNAGSCRVQCQGQGPAVRCSDGWMACGQGCSLPREPVNR